MRQNGEGRVIEAKVDKCMDDKSLDEDSSALVLKIPH